MIETEVITLLLLFFLLIIGIVIGRSRSLFAAVMLSGIFSLLSAALFVLMDAVDVAFTEAAVGAGISTVLMMVVLNLTTDKESAPIQPKIFPLLVALITGGTLLYATGDMPGFGDGKAPIHASKITVSAEDWKAPLHKNTTVTVQDKFENLVTPESIVDVDGGKQVTLTAAEHYVKESYGESHIPNIVTTVLGSYRGYDTLGETTVVLTAAIAVIMIIGRTRDKVATVVKPDSILLVGSKMLIPYILLFALYVQFHGDFGPGGGFQAGVIFAAAFILHAMVTSLNETQQALPFHVVEKLIPIGVVLYAGVGVVCILLGGNYLEYNVLDSHYDPAQGGASYHGQHLGIILIEAGVGITVFSAMVALFYKFALRGRK